MVVYPELFTFLTFLHCNFKLEISIEQCNRNTIILMIELDEELQSTVIIKARLQISYDVEYWYSFTKAPCTFLYFW